MKLAVPFLVIVMLWSLFALSLFGCDEPLSREAAHPATPSTTEHRVPSTTRSNRPTGWAESILSRADAAYAHAKTARANTEAHETGGTASTTRRSTSRVGPQPWPRDLPEAWPRLAPATLVADTQQSSGERLLLVDWPGSPENALDSIRQALVDRGYQVERPALRRERRALHAQTGDHEAVLTFHAREQVTRVEILILARATG